MELEVAPEFAPLEPKPQHVAVAEAIRRAIALGRYAPGDRLPAERELATLLGVGRMTLRAAIRQLNEEGMIRTTHGRSGGTFVVDSTLRRRSRPELVERYIGEIGENYEFRLAIEPFAARLSAERASAEQREVIGKLAAAQPESLAHYRTLDSRFHLALGESSGNRLVLEALRRARAEFFVWADVLWMLRESLSEETEESGKQHVAIAEAILERDPERAATEMIRHLEWARSSYVIRL